MARPTADRPISAAELAVVRAALAFVEVPDVDIQSLESLRVVGRCECGCDSVDFVRDGTSSGKVLIDLIGTTANGGMVGLLVWGWLGKVTALEVYDLGAGEDDIRLPLTDSLRLWG